MILYITEGKTDWQHMKSALTFLQNAGEYRDLEIDFLEFDSSTDMGDIKLSQICENLTLLGQMRKTIFIFDRDNPIIVQKMSGTPDPFRRFDNLIFSLCLPIHRIAKATREFE